MVRSRQSSESSVQSCYSTWSRTYFDEYYRSRSAYPPIHAAILKRLLRRAGVKSLLDAGCGPASFLRQVPRGIDVYGFDLTPEMVLKRSGDFSAVTIHQTI